MTVLEAVNCVYLKSQFERKLTSFSKDQSLSPLRDFWQKAFLLLDVM